MLDCTHDGFSLVERLTSTCVFYAEYSPFRAIYAVCLVVVLLWLVVARYLYDWYYRFFCGVSDFKLDDYLTKKVSKAVAVHFASFMLSIGIITRGSLNNLPIDYDKRAEYFYTFVVYQVLLTYSFSRAVDPANVSAPHLRSSILFLFSSSSTAS